MEIDWTLVKKKTLWSYEELIAKLQGSLSYPFVRQFYNHSLPEARAYAKAIRGGYLGDRGEMTGYIDSIGTHLVELESSVIGSYHELLVLVATREQCQSFLAQTGLDFETLIEILNYLMRWVLPFKNPLREFIDVDDKVESAVLQNLKQQKIGSNLDLLETGRSASGRQDLAGSVGVPLEFLTSLVHKADISRLAYVRGKTVRHLCGGGYDTLAKLARADLAEMEHNMDAYYRTFGKSLSDFKAVIPLSWMIGGAQILPRVFED